METTPETLETNKMGEQGEPSVEEAPEELSPEEQHYRAGKRELELAKVLVQPRDTARAYRRAAAEMKEAGDYLDAKALAVEYQKEAKRASNRGREAIYQKALTYMGPGSSEAERKLAINMFGRLKGYKDADDLAAQCRRKNREEVKKKDIRTAVVLVVIAAALLAGIGFWYSPLRKYMQAGRYFGQERYVRSQKLYEELGTYRDSQEKSLLAQEKAVEKTRAARLEKLRTIELGKTARFGSYKWRVLDRDETSVLLLGLESDAHEEWTNVAYNEDGGDVTWADSSLRSWLNGEFLQDYFEPEERERILLTSVENPDNAAYGTEGGEDTEDYVYLLSIDEVQQYQDRFAKLSLNWLLRSPGATQDAVAYVTDSRDVMEYGCPSDWSGFCIRPVIRVSIE